MTKDLRPKSEPIVIKGGKGKAAHVKKNDVIKIVNTHGSQVNYVVAPTTFRTLGGILVSCQINHDF